MSASTANEPTAKNGVVKSFPKLSPNPNNQYVNPPNTTSATFFIIILTSFLRDTHPDSRRPNPIFQRHSSDMCDMNL